jgi:hypothetical protein
MEVKASLIEPLFERVQEYGKTSFELLKLKSLEKTADITSSLVSRSLLVIVLSLCLLTLNIAISLRLGDVLGKNYFGFLVVASFYGLTGVILFFIHPVIKARVSDLVITQMRQ